MYSITLFVPIPVSVACLGSSSHTPEWEGQAIRQFSSCLLTIARAGFHRGRTGYLPSGSNEFRLLCPHPRGICCHSSSLVCFLFYFETGSLSIGLDSLEIVRQTILSSQRFTRLCLPKAGLKGLSHLALFILLTIATLMGAKWNSRPLQFVFPSGLKILSTFKSNCWAFLFLL